MLTDRRVFSCMGVVLSSLCCLRAALAGVDVGDVAPKLAIKEWVHGGPVDLGKDAAKKFHLVEFWATWCPPCKASIPLLTEYQKKFQSDLVVVGVTDPDPDRNSITEIRQFVKGQGKNMDYAVALDDGGKTTSAYMDTSQPVGIPQAYLVGKDGRVVWQGSPLDPELETVLKETIAGKYDVKAAKAVADRQRDLEKRFQTMDTAFQMGKLGAVWDGMQEILKLDPANEMAIHLAVAMYVNEEGYGDKLPALAKAHVAEHGRDMKAMFALAGALMEIEDLGRRQPELAVDAARAAYEAGDKADRAAIELYARAMYEIGALDQAIALQKEAVAKAGEGDKAASQNVLNYYESCKKLQPAKP